MKKLKLSEDSVGWGLVGGIADFLNIDRKAARIAIILLCLAISTFWYCNTEEERFFAGWIATILMITMPICMVSYAVLTGLVDLLNAE